ncbi:MAG TPA: hypothetical protein VF801_03040 [Rhodocyclaceae bacterium]
MPAPAAEQPADDSPAASAAAAADAAEHTHWQHAPIKWWGSTGSRLMKTWANSTPGATGSIQDVQLNASSYIWQPWFALVNGGFGLNSTGSKSYQTKDKSLSVTGSGNLVLFPQSRFPFQGSFTVADSRTDADLIGTSAYTSSTLYASQSYSPLGGGGHYNVDFTRSEMNGEIYGKDVQDSLSATGNQDIGDHHLQVNAVDTSDSRKAAADRSEVRTATLRDDFSSPENFLTVNSLASISQSDMLYSSTQSNVSFLQAMSFGTWRPDEDSPWLVSATARVYGSDVSNATASLRNTSKSDGYGASVGASYDWSKNLRFNGSGNLNVSDVAAAQALSANGTLGGAYISDPIPLGEFRYTWSAAANGGASFARARDANTAGATSSGTQFTESGSQTLTRDFTLSTTSRLSTRLVEALNLRQSNSAALGTTRSTDYFGLQHTAGLSWMMFTEDFRFMASTSVSDARSSGAVSDQINGQLSVDGNTGRNSSISGSISAQKTIQHSDIPLASSPASLAPGSPLPSITTFGVMQNQATSFNADITYINAKAFNIPRLRFKSILRGNNMLTDSRFNGAVGEPVENVQASWDNLLSYPIGNLLFSAEFRIARVSGRNNELIFFSMRRQLRGVL